ncbi:MAG: hypothetical protein WA865_00015 [Spirulinaceae cyanobacterium]
MQWNPNQSTPKLDRLKLSQGDISIVVRHSYSEPEQQAISPTLEVKFSYENSTECFDFLKCFLLLIKITQLPSEAIQESIETLEQIADFYSYDSSEDLSSIVTSEIVSGEIVTTETRSPLVLSWD